MPRRRKTDREGVAPMRGAFSLPAGGDGQGAGGGRGQDAAGARDRRGRRDALCAALPRRRCSRAWGAIRAGRRRLPLRPTRAWRAGAGRAGLRACRKAAATSARACSASSIALPPGPVVIIGTDVPGIAAAHIAAAFRLLGRHDAVFGPGHRRRLLAGRPQAAAARACAPSRGVRWSSPHALADTLANLAGMEGWICGNARRCR